MAKEKKPIKRITILWFDLHNRKPTGGAIYAVYKRFRKRKPVFIVTKNIKNVLEGHYDMLSTQEFESYGEFDRALRKRMREFKKANQKVYTLDCIDLPHDIWLVQDE